MIGSYALQIVRTEGPVHHAAVVTGGAGRFERAGVAGGCLGPIHHLLLGVFRLTAAQGLTLRATILVPLCIVGEVGGTIVRHALVPVRQGDVGPNARVFQGTDVLDRAIGRGGDGALGGEVPTE